MITLKPMDLLNITETGPMLEARNAAQLLNKLPIALSKSEGALLSFIFRWSGAARVIELGTLTGYSTLWLQQALPEDGQIWTIERESKHAEAARAIFAGLDSKKPVINLIEGEAIEALESLSAEAPFDGIFVDANKGAYWDYLCWAEKHIRPGGILVFDNVFLGGAVLDPNYSGKFSRTVIARMKNVIERLSDQKLYISHCFGDRDGLLCAKKLF